MPNIFQPFHFAAKHFAAQSLRGEQDQRSGMVRLWLADLYAAEAEKADQKRKALEDAKAQERVAAEKWLNDLEKAADIAAKPGRVLRKPKKRNKVSNIEIVPRETPPSLRPAPPSIDISALEADLLFASFKLKLLKNLRLDHEVALLNKRKREEDEVLTLLLLAA